MNRTHKLTLSLLTLGIVIAIAIPTEYAVSLALTETASSSISLEAPQIVTVPPNDSVSFEHIKLPHGCLIVKSINGKPLTQLELATWKTTLIEAVPSKQYERTLKIYPSSSSAAVDDLIINNGSLHETAKFSMQFSPKCSIS